MPVFRIKHTLPDGSVAGYVADSCGTIVKNPADAKPAATTPEHAAEWLANARATFEYTWNPPDDEFGGGKKYREWEGWKGHSIEEIKTEIEEIPGVDESMLVTRARFIDFDEHGKMIVGPAMIL